MSRTSRTNASARYRIGVCINEECELSKEKSTQQIRMSKEFVCEKCGNELLERRPPKKNPLPIYIIGGIIGLSVLGGGGAAYYFGKDNRTIKPPGGVEGDTTIVDSINPNPPIDPVTPPIPPNVGLTFPYGYYTGDIVNQKANGQGKMVYKSKTLISKHDSKKRYAEAGQYIIGTWYDNKLDFGKLYDKNNVMIETITIGRAE